MSNDDDYLRAIEALKRNRPKLPNKEKLTDDIMRKLNESSDKFTRQEKLVNYIFGWVNIYWLRGTMAVAAALFIGFFIIQQLVFAERLDNLERQLVKTLDAINGYEPDLGINQKILLNLVLNDQMMEDSITVSTADMKDLLDYYLELENNYENLMQNVGPIDPYIQKRIRESFKESISDDEPQ